MRKEGVEGGEEGRKGGEGGREGERTHTKNVTKHLITPALRPHSQEDRETKTSLGY